MTTLYRQIFPIFMLVALCVHAQPAINLGATPNPSNAALPLRNLQIEVRQVQHEDSQRSGVQSNTRVEVGTGGQVGIGGQLQVEQRQSRQSSSATQYALVLNGRSTRISLGSSTPLRLMQTYYRNGTVFITQSAVMLEANTGFVATPRWDGGDRVELEISAQQTGRTGASQTSGASSTLVLPLGEWTTVAQSEQSSTGTSSGLGSASSQTGQSAADVQVRLTVR